MSVVLRRVISGVFGGSLFGAVIGVYVFMMTADSVILRDDFDHVVSWEQAADRFRWTLPISFSIVFALVGPFVASTCTKVLDETTQMRHSGLGFLCRSCSAPSSVPLPLGQAEARHAANQIFPEISGHIALHVEKPATIIRMVEISRLLRIGLPSSP